MPLTVPVGAYLLAATAFTETTLILFLHLLGAMATLGGALGVLVLYYRARGAIDAAELRTTVSILDMFGQRVLLPAAGLTGVIGLILAYRFDARGLFAVSHQGWLVVAVVLWLIMQGTATRAVRASVAAVAALGADGDLPAAKARLGTASAAGPAWLTLILTVVIVYLMVFQPFVSS